MPMKEKNTRLFLFFILVILFFFAPVLAQAPALELKTAIALPSTGINGNHTPHIHIADNGQLVALSYENTPDLFVYDGDGSFLWNSTLSAESSPWISSVSIAPEGQELLVTQLVPAYGHGSVTNTSSNKVILFNRAGLELWEYSTYSPPYVSVVSNNNKEIILGTQDGQIISLNKNGTPRWSTRVDAPVLSLATSGDGGTIVATGESNYYFNKLYNEPLNPHDLFVLDTRGILLWKYSTGGRNKAAVSNDGSVIAVTEENSGNVLLFNRSGSKHWERSLGEPVSALAVSGDGNLVVVMTRGGVVSGFDRNGLSVWRVSVEPESHGIAFIGNQNDVLLGNQQTIARYDKSGNLLETYPADSRILSIETSHHGQSFIVGTEQKLVFFSEGKTVPGAGNPEVTRIPPVRSPTTVPPTQKEAPLPWFVSVIAVSFLGLFGYSVARKRKEQG